MNKKLEDKETKDNNEFSKLFIKRNNLLSFSIENQPLNFHHRNQTDAPVSFCVNSQKFF